MKQAELIRRLRKIAKLKGVAFRVEKARGKGSHAAIWMGDRRTVAPREAADGTILAIRKQLGVSREDWES